MREWRGRQVERYQLKKGEEWQERGMELGERSKRVWNEIVRAGLAMFG